MKQLIILIMFIAPIARGYCQTGSVPKTNSTMKLNAGIVTPLLAESKDFYTRILGFEVLFENEFYLLMHPAGEETPISFLLPEHASQQPLFHQPFNGQGVYLTLEVEDVDVLYKKITEKGVTIKIPIRDEPWGDRHFAITDPNGVNIDIVRYSPPAAQK